MLLAGVFVIVCALVFTYSSCGLHVFLLPFELVFNLSFIFNLISGRPRFLEPSIPAPRCV